MDAISHERASALTKQRIWIAVVAIALIALAIGAWIWHIQSTVANAKGAGAFQVVSAPVTQADVSVRLTANGTVSASANRRCAAADQCHDQSCAHQGRAIRAQGRPLVHP